MTLAVHTRTQKRKGEFERSLINPREKGCKKGGTTSLPIEKTATFGDKA